MITLLPRLAGPAADRLLDDFFRSEPAGWAGFDPSNLPDGVRFAATGGAKVNAADLQGFRQELLEVARRCGLGSEATRQGHARFDAETAAWLAQHRLLASGEALRDDVWAFFTVSLAPDIVHWRFGAAPERYLGGVRNTLQRLWMRGRVMDRGEDSEDRWGLLRELTEDALVQITERPSIGGDPILAGAIGEAWVRAASHHGKSAMESIMRRAALRVRIWNEVRTLSRLAEGSLREILDEAMELPTLPLVATDVASDTNLSNSRSNQQTDRNGGARVELAQSAILLEREATERGLLSPKSKAALESVKAGKLPLTESEGNALRHLIARLRELRAQPQSTEPVADVLAAPSVEAGSPPTSKNKWSIWRKE